MKRVLLVDDYKTTRPLKARLEQDGFEVLSVSDPRAALGALTQRDFDVVVSDMDVPDVNGHTILQTAHLTQPRASLILVTTRTEKLDLPQGVAQLNKPVDYERLTALLHQSEYLG